MALRSLMFGLLALIIGGATVFGLRNYIASQQRIVQVQAPAVPPPAGLEILVARQALPAGTFLKPEHLRWQAWPEGAIASNYLLRNKHLMDDQIGAVVRRGIAEGEPITEGRVIRPNERGFVAAVLEPGMRAVAVGLSAATGAGGLVFPGDRVDVILAQKIEERGSATTDREIRHASETVVQDVRVLAVDQTTNDQGGKPVVAKTATLEVSPQQAEVIALANELGKLSLSLMSLGRPDDDSKLKASAPGKGFTFDTDASRAIASRAAGGPMINVLRGSEAETVQIGGAP